MKTILYIHGYGSNSNATKAQLLKAMVPEHRVIVPTYDFNHHTAGDIQGQIRQTVESEKVDMLLGSSLGGFHTLCTLPWFEGPVWAVNPVTDPLPQFKKAIIPRLEKQAPQLLPDALKNLNSYQGLVNEVFRHLPQRDGQVSLALSTDDETLGDHHHTASLFPKAAYIIWRDNSGHHFTRFEELREAIRATIDKI